VETSAENVKNSVKVEVHVRGSSDLQLARVVHAVAV
jgi:hypothetical protein